MFEGWGNYYFLLGSVAAALIGVMALVATLTSGSDRSRAQQGQRLFLTPTVFHLATVLALSAIALAPHLAPIVQALILGGFALYGVGFAAVIVVQALRINPNMSSHWSDFWCYGAAPLGAHAAVVLAIGWSVLARQPPGVLLALALLALLLIAIRNAWDLVTWLAPMRNAVRPPPPESGPTP
jgi:hypothetical protein